MTESTDFQLLQAKLNVALVALLQKIAEQGGVILYPSDKPKGLGFDYCFVELTSAELALWKAAIHD